MFLWNCGGNFDLLKRLLLDIEEWYDDNVDGVAGEKEEALEYLHVQSARGAVLGPRTARPVPATVRTDRNMTAVDPRSCDRGEGAEKTNQSETTKG